MVVNSKHSQKQKFIIAVTEFRIEMDVNAEHP
jgi:hypothetical protein